jgi:DinB superfamily
LGGNSKAKNRVIGPGKEGKFGFVNRREQLLKRLDRAWRAFQESYAGLSGTERLEAGVTGNWSVKDVVAHVTVWEEEALKHLPLILAGGKPPRYGLTYGGIDAFNAQTMKQKRDLSLSEVLQQSEAVHQRLVAFVENAPEEQLGSETRFRHRLRLDTYGHYAIHTRAIRQWRGLKLT